MERDNFSWVIQININMSVLLGFNTIAIKSQQLFCSSCQADYKIYLEMQRIYTKQLCRTTELEI